MSHKLQKLLSEASPELVNLFKDYLPKQVSRPKETAAQAMDRVINSKGIDPLLKQSFINLN